MHETGGKPRAIVSWSSGKDSAFALHVVQSAAELDVIALFTTVNHVHDRVASHQCHRRSACQSLSTTPRNLNSF